jgi:hypothetical protein
MKIFLILISFLIASCSSYKIGTTPDDVYYSYSNYQEEYLSVNNKDNYRYDNTLRQGVSDRRFRIMEDEDWYYWNRVNWNLQVNTWNTWNPWTFNTWAWNNSFYWNNTWYWNSWVDTRIFNTWSWSNSNYWYNKWRWENRFSLENGNGNTRSIPSYFNTNNTKTNGIKYSPPALNIDRGGTNRPARFFDNSSNNTKTFNSGTNINSSGSSRYFTPSSSGTSNSGGTGGSSRTSGSGTSRRGG